MNWNWNGSTPNPNLDHFKKPLDILGRFPRLLWMIFLRKIGLSILPCLIARRFILWIDEKS